MMGRGLFVLQEQTDIFELIEGFKSTEPFIFKD